MRTRSASNAHPSVDDEDGGLVSGNINRPFRAADRCNRLRRNDLKSITAGFRRNLDQQGLAIELNRSNPALPPAPQGKTSALFGDDRDSCAAVQSLRVAYRVFRGAALNCRLRGGALN